MGMFDTLLCEMELPGGIGKTDRSFQTKDLDNSLSLFKIKENGELWQVAGPLYSEVLPDQETFPEAHWSHWWGLLRFYAFWEDDSEKGQGWMEFEAKVRRGVVEEIEVIELYKNKTERRARSGSYGTGPASGRLDGDSDQIGGSARSYRDLVKK